MEVTQHMKVVKKTSNVPNVEVVRRILRVDSAGLVASLHTNYVCVCVERKSKRAHLIGLSETGTAMVGIANFSLPKTKHKEIDR
jgi:hypothetical protein